MVWAAMYLFLLILLAYQLAAQKVVSAATAPTSPLKISLGDSVVSGDDAVLDYGHIGGGTRFPTTLAVKNTSKQALIVDAFSFGDEVLAVWEIADGSLSTRAELAADAELKLRITLLGLPNKSKVPSVVLMQGWSEVAHIDVLYLATPIPEGTLEYQFPVDPALWHISGSGKNKASYRFCTPPPPPGFEIVDRAAGLWSSPTDQRDGDPRGCHTYAFCGDPVAANQGEGVCYAPWVQGHERTAGDDDRTVAFRFAIRIKLAPIKPKVTLKSAASLKSAIKE